jgi:hypothetical protein
MTRPLIDQIARAVLYEGYILYPYRPSVKTRQRWNFGGVYPRTFSEAQSGADPWTMQVQCLFAGNPGKVLKVDVRFLQLVNRTIEKSTASGFERVQSLEFDGRDYAPWQEAIERSVEIEPIAAAGLSARPIRREFMFPEAETLEPLGTAGRLVRRRQRIDGAVLISVRPVDGIFQLTVQVANESHLDDSDKDDRDEALMRSFASTHIALGITGGAFVSSTDPPEPFKAAVGDCSNTGCWPVLIGEPGQTDTMLASPIILSDYPQVAPESPGDLFDGCEIDEILTLRIMTLTDDEKRQAAGIDPLAADLIARTESLAREQLMNLHGVMKPVHAATGVHHG